jgi:hypothetical protein
MDMKHAMWNIRSIYRTGLFTVDNELKTNSGMQVTYTRLTFGQKR